MDRKGAEAEVMNPIPAEVLDNRELALLIWIVILVVGGCVYPSTRPSFLTALGGLLHWKILVVFVTMAVYLAAVVYGLWLIDVWTWTLIAETGFWFAGPAALTLFRVDSAKDDPDFFKKLLVTTLKYTLLVEFVVNLYAGHLIVELLLVPILVVLGGSLALAQAKEETKQIVGFIQTLITLVVLGMILYSVVRAIRDPSGFLSLDTLREFVLPVLLTITFVPYFYTLALVFAWEGLFVRMRILMKDEPLFRYARRRVFRLTFMRLGRLRRFLREHPLHLMKARSRAEVKVAIRRILTS